MAKKNGMCREFPELAVASFPPPLAKRMALNHAEGGAADPHKAQLHPPPPLYTLPFRCKFVCSVSLLSRDGTFSRNSHGLRLSIHSAWLDILPPLVLSSFPHSVWSRFPWGGSGWMIKRMGRERTRTAKPKPFF